jgi:thiamine-phosphate pyrophosphorylase
MKLPRLYAIADVGVLQARGVEFRQFAEGLRDAGVSLVQLRDKFGSPEEVLRAAALLREVLGHACLLIMNDRVDLALLASFHGVHVGQTDLSPRDAKAAALGAGQFVVGVSTHRDAQVRAAEATPADYLAIGPVFATGTKPDAEPVVGLEGIRRARALTTRPLVAIGGISRANCRSVLDAGADSVAVISGLIQPGESVAKVARDFLDILR